MTYLVVKSLHVVAVIAWMAGLLYLPRLFVYHAGAKRGSQVSETFKVMERRLFKAIMNPAMLAVWVLGLWLVYASGAWSEYWFHAKFVLVCALTAFHHVLERWRRDFEGDRNERPARFYRIANEVPAVAMILIVLLVITRPF